MEVKIISTFIDIRIFQDLCYQIVNEVCMNQYKHISAKKKKERKKRHDHIHLENILNSVP